MIDASDKEYHENIAITKKVVEMAHQCNVSVESELGHVTGLGDIFPSGILIGNVDSITKDNFDLSKTVLVSSSVNFDNINYVTVLIKGEEK